MVATRCAVLVVVENVVAILARQLGLIHGLVGLPEELVGVDVVLLRIEGDAEAGGDLEHSAAHPHGLRDRIKQAGKQGQAHALPPLATMSQIGHHNDELIAAETGDGIVFAQGQLHACGQGPQELVAGLMAVIVIDGLEAIQVEVGQGQPGVRALDLRHGLPQAVAKQDPVRQPGQGIIMGDVHQLTLMLLALGDVRVQRHVAQDLSLAIVDRADGEHGDVLLARLAPVPDLTVPMAVLDQVAPHGRVEFSVWRPELRMRGFSPRTSSRR